MNTYFENKILYDGISFQLTNSPQVEEREIHSYHEILFLIEGNGDFFAENMQTKLQGNTLFIIPRGNYHFYRFQKAKTFTRLKIGFSDEVIKATPFCSLMGKLCVLDNLNDEITFSLNRLYHIMKEQASQKQGFYAYSTFLTLLTELDIFGINANTDEKKLSSAFVTKIIKYISENISKELTITALSKNTHISPSTITHYFKKELGTSVHRYITQRRLIYAKSLIDSGYKPSKIYFECGYKDYSSFYKAYIKFFGHSPSEEKNTEY